MKQGNATQRSRVRNKRHKGKRTEESMLQQEKVRQVQNTEGEEKNGEGKERVLLTIGEEITRLARLSRLS